MNRLPIASAVHARALVPGVPPHAVWLAQVCDGCRQNGTYRLASMGASERGRFGGGGWGRVSAGGRLAGVLREGRGIGIPVPTRAVGVFSRTRGYAVESCLCA